jgi:hypothetical protein
MGDGRTQLEPGQVTLTWCTKTQRPVGGREANVILEQYKELLKRQQAQQALQAQKDRLEKEQLKNERLKKTRLEKERYEQKLLRKEQNRPTNLAARQSDRPHDSLHGYPALKQYGARLVRIMMNIFTISVLQQIFHLIKVWILRVSIKPCWMDIIGGSTARILIACLQLKWATRELHSPLSCESGHGLWIVAFCGNWNRSRSRSPRSVVPSGAGDCGGTLTEVKLTLNCVSIRPIVVVSVRKCGLTYYS